jgi:hypothetical protein
MTGVERSPTAIPRLHSRIFWEKKCPISNKVKDSCFPPSLLRITRNPGNTTIANQKRTLKVGKADYLKTPIFEEQHSRAVF